MFIGKIWVNFLFIFHNLFIFITATNIDQLILVYNKELRIVFTVIKGTKGSLQRNSNWFIIQN